jgi:hypothetical protein
VREEEERKAERTSVVMVGVALLSGYPGRYTDVSSIDKCVRLLLFAKCIKPVLERTLFHEIESSVTEEMLVDLHKIAIVLSFTDP